MVETRDEWSLGMARVRRVNNGGCVESAFLCLVFIDITNEIVYEYCVQ